jgi:hypothetical protein
MNRLDQEIVPTRAGVLLDYVELCSNICAAPELPSDDPMEDVVGEFVDECCIQEPGAKVNGSKIYNRFVEYYKENYKSSVPSGTFFGRRLSRSFEKKKINGLTIYYGIGLKLETESEE